MEDKKKTGFAVIDTELRRRIASAGGKSHDVEHMREMGRKGGATVSKDREHMSRIGKIGGKKSRKPVAQ